MRKTKRLICSIFLLYFFANCFAQEYEEIFTNQYNRALVLKNDYLELLNSKKIDNPEFYLAIVFPEMERYTVKRDWLETTLNKISVGKISEYEEFSIGAFQIKPKFALQLEESILKNQKLKKKYSDLIIYDKDSDYEIRIERINRLGNKNYQILYLLAFVDICTEKYSLESLVEEEKLRYLSVIYNCGFKDSLDEYNIFLTQKAFPYGVESPRSRWNYTDLVLHYYKKNNEK